MWSDENYRIFGHTRGTPQSYETFLATVHPEDREFVDRMWQAGLRGEPYDIEHRIIVAGEVRWVRERAELELDAQGHLLGGFGTTQDVTELIDARQRLRAALEEKEVLLKEIHHRVKNNLQVIASMLSLQAASIQDEASRAQLLESQHRVRTIALVHEKLYCSKDFTRIPFRTYAEELASYLHHSLAKTGGQVVLDCQIDDVEIEVSTAIPLALILNELLSNALKHAFPDGREGRVTLALSQAPEGPYEFSVADDGVGFPAGLDFRSTESMGLQIVTILAQQIGGVLAMRRDGGTTFVLRFGSSRP
jgi:PAS domain S-box-containing protein